MSTTIHFYVGVFLMIFYIVAFKDKKHALGKFIFLFKVYLRFGDYYKLVKLISENPLIMENGTNRNIVIKDRNNPGGYIQPTVERNPTGATKR